MAYKSHDIIRELNEMGPLWEEQSRGKPTADIQQKQNYTISHAQKCIPSPR